MRKGSQTAMARKGEPTPQETRAKMRAAALGRPKSEAHRKAISEGKRGRPGRRLSEQEIEAIRARRLGTTWSSAQRAKLTGPNSPHFGKPPRHKPRVEYAGVRMRSSWEVAFDERAQTKARLFRKLFPEFPLVVATRPILRLTGAIQ
jgi:hypothetical protein